MGRKKDNNEKGEGKQWEEEVEDERGRVGE